MHIRPAKFLKAILASSPGSARDEPKSLRLIPNANGMTIQNTEECAAEFERIVQAFIDKGAKAQPSLSPIPDSNGDNALFSHRQAMMNIQHVAVSIASELKLNPEDPGQAYLPGYKQRGLETIRKGFMPQDFADFVTHTLVEENLGRGTVKQRR